jgi:hypothetical protein
MIHLRRPLPVKHTVLGFSLLSGLTLVSACQPCGQTGTSIFADVKTTHITAPPGGPSFSGLEVEGSHFTPSSPITLTFSQYPALDAMAERFQEATSANGVGAFDWPKDFSQLPARNFSSDPSVTVNITAKETNGGCFALTSISAGKILHPPL